MEFSDNFSLYQCRKLSELDRENIIKLAETRDTLIKAPVNAEILAGFVSSLDKYLSPESEAECMFGVFYKDQLICIWGIRKWDTLPYCTLVDFKIDKSLSSPSVAKNCVKKGLEGILDWGHHNGVDTYYYLIAARYIGKGYLLDSDGHSILEEIFPVMHRYHFNLEAYIPAGSRPRSSTYWRMMGFRTHDVNLCIRRVTLRDKFKLEHLSKMLGMRCADDLFQ